MKWSDLLREAAEKYQAGRSLEKLAAEYGVTYYQLRKRLSSKVTFRKATECVRPAPVLPIAEIVARYRDLTGTLYGMAKEYRVPPSAIRKVLTDAGTEIRRPGAVMAAITHRRTEAARSARNAEIVRRLTGPENYQQLADAFGLDFRTIATIARKCGATNLKGKYKGARYEYCPVYARIQLDKQKAKRAAARGEQRASESRADL